LKTEIIQFLGEYIDDIENRWRAQLQMEMPELFKDSLRAELTERTITKAIKTIQSYLDHEDLDLLVQEISEVEKPIRKFMPLLEAFETSTYDVLLEKRSKTPEELVTILQSIRKVKKRIYTKVVDLYEERYEKIISLQKLALKELSTPIMPIFDHVIVVPIIGTIDTERAKQIMENVLNAVVKNKSKIVLIDITGVPVVDTVVAHHLIQVVSAVHIVGGKSMLVGIRPEIAQTLVTLGIDLSSVSTLGTLQEGVQKALQLTNRTIGEVNEQ